MLTAIFRRCLNLIWSYVPTRRLAMGTACTQAKEGRQVSPPHCRERSYSIAKQSVRMIGTMYPPPPPREEPKMTPRYIRLLPLLAWGFALLLGTASSAPAQSTTDYDDDDDGLIDITTLAQLNAMRWDRDGEGDVAAGDAANYLLAFPNRDINAATRMGCPSPSDPSESPCKGYELRTDLDFDTTGDDIADAPYANWVPIPRYAAVFKGNNHTISNLTISGNTTLTDIGLFGFLFSSFGSISGVGLKDVKINVTVPGTSYAGALVGKNNGTVRSCYATGSVTVNTMGSDIEVGGLVGSSYSGYYTDPEIAASWSSADVSATGPGAVHVGGLVGWLQGAALGSASIIACYATGSVSAIDSRSSPSIATQKYAGGLVGHMIASSGQQASITASYATGPVSVPTWVWNSGSAGGLVGFIRDNSTITDSYWDTETTGFADDSDSTPPEGKTTSELQSVTSYTGIYANWNVNVDGMTGNDDPWNFGTSAQYPMLKFGRAPQVPGVSVTPGPGALVVSWPAVLGATGYKVQWKSGDENYDTADRQAVVTGTTYTIPNLIVNTEYTVRVIATRTNAYDGPASEEVTGTPGESGTTLPEPDPDTEPGFNEAVGPQSYRQDKAIEPLTLPAATDGNGTVTYSLTGLPEGLHFDAETLIVSGTPSEATEKAIYTLTATDEDGDEATMSFFITVIANRAPSFGDASVDAQAYMRKQEIDPVTLPQATGGDEPLTYALTGLPEGLTFDAETRSISGTPLEAIDETTYTLTATDSDGDAATLMFTLEVIADLMPSFGDTTVAAQVYVQHREVDPLALPQAAGGDGTLTYALTPDLPEGLRFDAETLIISGTPVKAKDAMTYTLTATDGNGDEVHLMFTLEVPDLMPTFGDTTITAQSYLVNQEIDPVTLPQATSGDGMLAYILLPSLPDGLTFDYKTRVLSGMPSEATAQATYTLSALDADGDVASLTFTIDVQLLPSPDFDGDGQVNFADFMRFAGKYGTRRGEDGYDPWCDLNGDSQIDFDDFLIFAAAFGSAG